MTVRAFRADGTEVDLSPKKRTPRSLTPFERGFHEAVLNKSLEENPFAPYTKASEEWESGWNIYTNRKLKMNWYDPLINAPGATDEKEGITFLCLVKDRDGYYLHKPCKTTGLLIGRPAFWSDYKGYDGVNVIEYAWVPMKHPHLVNAMQASINWASET